MPKKSIHHDPAQQDLSSYLAADYLHRNAPKEVLQEVDHRYLRVRPSHEIKRSSVVGESDRWRVACVEVKQTSAQHRQMGLGSFPLCNDPVGPAAPIYVQKVKVYCDKIIRYPIRYDDGPTRQVAPTSQANLTRGIFKGYISKESGRVIRKRLEGWIKAVNTNRDVAGRGNRPYHSHIVFATLTLPSKQVHGDNEIKRKCLMPFQQELKRRFGVEETFWSAEPQENGNIHFHCLYDRYIPADKLNDLWNCSVNHLGYFNRYVESTGDTNPPSTQIRVTPSDMSQVKYVMKYVSKQPEIRCSLRPSAEGNVKRVSYWSREEIKGGVDEIRKKGYDLESCNVEHWAGKWYRYYERRPIEGRSWGMSKGLAKLDVFSTEATYRVNDLLTIAEFSPQVAIKQVDHAEVFLMNTYDFMMRHDAVLLQDYRNYYLDLYQSIYHPPDLALPEVIPIALDRGVEFEPSRDYVQLRIAV